MGDLIDRGPKQRETVELVRELCDQKIAICLTGNHEYNAVAFVTPRIDSPNRYVRSHTDSHILQHKDFLNAFANDQTAYRETIDWFSNLPLWFETDSVRAVHACWNRAAQKTLQPLLNQFNAPNGKSFYEQTGIVNSPTRLAREILLNGVEKNLPNGAQFTDYYGITRHRIRINWWDKNQFTYREAAVVDARQRPLIPDIAMAGGSPSYQEKLCFFGHYWMQGKPMIKNQRAVCLDYSVALKNGILCAYRFDGENEATNENLRWVNRIHETK